jgi:hypothetical protein
MKSKVLLLGAVVTAFAISSFAAEPLLSPRAAGNQIKIVKSSVPTPTVAAAYVAPGNVLFSPRAQGNQIKVASGLANDSNPSLTCRSGMAGSPKALAECSQHTTMPGCQTVALKE